jgi:hypothetical protein
MPGVPRSLHAKEIANLVSEALGNLGGDHFGSRMSNVLFFALRAALEVRDLSLLEVRSLLVNDQYLNGLLRQVQDHDIKEYFVYRFPRENKEAIQAVVSRLDLLLLEDTARVLCAPGCLSFSELLEQPLTVMDVGGAPRGARFLTRWWLGVCVRGLTAAIFGRPPRRPPAFAVLDEWWMGLDDDLATDFEWLLSLARHKNVALWLLNQLPEQVSSRSPSLLATIKSNCGLQIAFRQSHDNARALSYMLPVSENLRVRKSPDHPKWDTRSATAEEQRKTLVEELPRLPRRHFWLYPREFGTQAVKLVAPTVPFEEARRLAERAPDWLRRACRGHRGGVSRRELDEALARRRANIAATAAGTKAARPDLGRSLAPELNAQPVSAPRTPKKKSTPAPPSALATAPPPSPPPEAPPKAKSKAAAEPTLRSSKDKEPVKGPAGPRAPAPPPAALSPVASATPQPATEEKISLTENPDVEVGKGAPKPTPRGPRGKGKPGPFLG